jgi:hypothetical protein
MAERALIRTEITPLTSHVGGKYTDVSDQDLLANTRRLVGATNQILAELLAHLAEVEARGAHRVRLCTSLYTYCVYELQFSEDAAFRRVSAARLLRKFPALYDVLASGELHLTGLLQLGQYLTPENLAELLARAKHRTKKEIAKLVRQIDPLPDVPASIQPLGPALPSQVAQRNPTWQEYMNMLNPVNHLPAGDRPRDWMSDTPFSLVPRGIDPAPIEAAVEEPVEGVLNPPGELPGEAPLHGTSELPGEAPLHGTSELPGESMLHGTSELPGEPMLHGTSELPKPPLAGGPLSDEGRGTVVQDAAHSAATSASSPQPDLGSPVRAFRRPTNKPVEPTGPQRFSVQFTVGQAYVDLVARAQALLSHGPGGSLEQVHFRALELLVSQLERKRFGAPKGCASWAEVEHLGEPASPPSRRPSRAAVAEGSFQTNPQVRASPPSSSATAGDSAAQGPEGPAHNESTGAKGGSDDESGVARQRGGDDESGDRSQRGGDDESGDRSQRGGDDEGGVGRERGDRSRGGRNEEGGNDDEGGGDREGDAPRERGRYLPAAVRRAVFERDGLRCTHVDETGERCTETHRLEFHHIRAFARAGEHSTENISLRCRAHNVLAAEVDFGVEATRLTQDRQGHESFARQSDT